MCAPLQVLTDDATVAGWVRQMLPSDPTSVASAAIAMTTEKWPLLLDPQLQVWGRAFGCPAAAMLGWALWLTAPQHARGGMDLRYQCTRPHTCRPPPG